MISMKKTTTYFAAIGLVAALAAPAYADTVTNLLATNKLASNKLASNKLASNKLASNKLAVNGLGVAVPAGEGAVADIVGIELQDGTSFAR